ncbi:hypothetical protein BL253_02615 [Pseudofrankia asymbiotica]|uniref:Uncharacterized protein n=1 Tax=Pseudofrankia asymbiotica TaxID=1834516 RepID=A0A1V2IL10_9ACTN|nr:hypothetical protein BL253_02615 [Pseudofrankia asymbiotica]
MSRRWPAPPPSPSADEPTAPPRESRARPTGGRGRRPGDDNDGALRGLVGAGRSKLSLSAAMRARDVARPDADDVARAERAIAERFQARSGADRPAPDRDRASADRASPARLSGRPSPSWAARRGQTAGGAGAPEGTGGSSPVRS